MSTHQVRNMRRPLLNIDPWCCFAIVAVLVASTTPPAIADWPQFRGPGALSVAEQETLPVKISEDNVAWKVDLPGQGVSGAIVVGDSVIVTCSSGYRERRLHVLSLGAADGQVQWHRQFEATGRTNCHPSTAVAAPTPASDGKRIVAFFSSNDLACLDLEGNLLWYRGLTVDHPTAANDTGMASSPLVTDDTVFVQVQSQGESFAAAIDADTGETRWQVPMERRANWATPVRYEPSQGDARVLLQSPSSLAAIMIESGKPAWELKTDCASMASCVVSGGDIVAPADGLSTLRPAGSHADSVWSNGRLAPGPASPVVYQNHLYVLNRAGILSCGNLENGEVAWKKRLKGSFWATPVAVGGHLYCVNQDGTVIVASIEQEGEIVSEFELGEAIYASPAVADDAIYFRSDEHLWKITESAGR